MNLDNIGPDGQVLFAYSQLDESQSTNDISQISNEDEEQLPWVRKHFKVIVSDGKKRRACLVVGCTQTYEFKASHTVLKRHYTNNHKDDMLPSKLLFSNEPHIDAVVKCIVVDKLPYSEVEAKGFKHLWSTVALGKRLPSRQEISELVISKRRDIQELIKKQLEGAPSIGLTFDIWSNRGRTHGYGCIMAHFLCSKDILQVVPLQFAYMPCPHNGESIFQFLHDTIKEYNIQKKVVGITTDNASENPRGIEQLCQKLQLDLNFSVGFLYFRCAAHVINLAVKESLKPLKEQIADIRRVIVAIRGSPKRIQAFDAIQRELLATMCDSQWTSPLRLKEDVDTRWNSTFAMLERAHLLRAAIDRALLEMKDLHDLQISHIDWPVIKAMIVFLEPFNEVTEQLSGEKYPTISMVNAYLPKLKAHLEQEFDDESITSAAKAFRNKLDEYEVHIDQPTAVIATVLDPRFKLTPIPELARPFVRDNLLRLLEPVAEADVSLSQEVRRSCFQDVYAAAESDEVKVYLEALREPKACDIVSYWKLNKLRFPRLYKLAMTVLPLQATSVSCERAFSAAGLVDTPRRNKLSTDSFGANMLVGMWIRYFNMV